MDAKRNARRRRILENSEKRLSKITGKNEDSESKSQSIHSGLSSENLLDEDVETEPLRLDLNGKIPGINGACTRTKLSPPTLLTNRVNYVLLAVLVNVLLLLKLDHLFGKTIAVPYLPIMLGRLYNYKTSREMQESNLLYAALILCNIKPKLTYQLKKMVTIVRVILGDLALYIFSFTLIHYGFFYSSLDTNVAATSDA